MCYVQIFAKTALTRDVEGCFREDLKSFAYVLLYCLRPELSWDRIKTMPIKDLCQNLPDEFATCFNYIDNLQSDEKPHYSYLRDLFKDLYLTRDFGDPYGFDWLIYKYSEDDTALEESPASEPQTSTPAIHLQNKSGFTQRDITIEVTKRCEELAMSLEECLKPGDTKIKLHLHHHVLAQLYDITIISQHPSASGPVSTLVLDFWLPTKVWRRCIQPILQHLRDLPEMRSDYLSFLRPTYSLVLMLYKTTPQFDTIWVEYLCPLAEALRDSDEDGASWDRRILYWNSLRDPTIAGVLQADIPNTELVL
jgi:hypothetical protein